MYRLPLKIAVMEALNATFNENYPDPDFRQVNVSMDYPVKAQSYPGIWLNFREEQPVSIAGIAHTEIYVDDDGINHQVGRWTFGGSLTLTVVALTSPERDRLFDQVVRVLMTSNVDATQAGQFKSMIENNDLIGMNFNYDTITVSGDDAAPGTPWNTNEVIYEVEIAIDLIGEFVSDPDTNILVPLSRVAVSGFVEGSDDDPFDPESDTSIWNPDEWS